MVRPPTPTEEDERRLTREREILVTERTRHVNRTKSLLATQGVFGFEPMHKDRRTRLEQLQCWDGQPLPPQLKIELVRELDRLELVTSQLAELEAQRDSSGLPSFLYRTEHLNENWLCYQHFSEPFDQGP